MFSDGHSLEASRYASFYKRGVELTMMYPGHTRFQYGFFKIAREAFKVQTIQEILETRVPCFASKTYVCL